MHAGWRRHRRRRGARARRPGSAPVRRITLRPGRPPARCGYPTPAIRPAPALAHRLPPRDRPARWLHCPVTTGRTLLRRDGESTTIEPGTSLCRSPSVRAELDRRRSAAPRALDAGCGTGFQAAICSSWATTTGLDISSGLLRAAQHAARTPASFRATSRLPAATGRWISSSVRQHAVVRHARNGPPPRSRVLRPAGASCRGQALESRPRLAARVGLAGDPLEYGVGPAGRRASRRHSPTVFHEPGYPGSGSSRSALRRPRRAASRASGLGRPRRHQRHPPRCSWRRWADDRRSAAAALDRALAGPRAGPRQQPGRSP
jgi:hypothetical protein